MLVVLILVPAIIVAVAVVLLLDRVGVLPRMDGGNVGPGIRVGGGAGRTKSDVGLPSSAEVMKWCHVLAGSVPPNTRDSPFTLTSGRWLSA